MLFCQWQTEQSILHNRNDRFDLTWCDRREWNITSQVGVYMRLFDDLHEGHKTTDIRLMWRCDEHCRYLIIQEFAPAVCSSHYSCGQINTFLWHKTTHSVRNTFVRIWWSERIVLLLFTLVPSATFFSLKNYHLFAGMVSEAGFRKQRVDW